MGEPSYYQRIVESSHEGIWAIDLDGKTTFANAAMAAMLACTVDELMASSMWDFMDADDRETAAANLERRTRGISEVHDFRFRRKGGGHILTSLTTFPMAGPDGRPGAVGMVRDVTAERLMARALETSETRLVSALTAARLYTWEFDPASRAIQWSDSAFEILGLPLELELDLDLLLELTHPDDREDLRHQIDQWAGPDLQIDFEHRIVRRDGQVRWLRTTGRGVGAPSGGATRVYGATQDVTDRRLLEQEFLRARELEGIGRLASGVAHDFNNLITAILTSVSFIARSGHHDVSDLDIIRTAAHRAGLLVGQLQRFAGKQRLDRVALDLNDVVVDLESMLHRLCGEHGRLSLDLEPGLPPILGDDGALGQVLIQLVANAGEALDRQGRVLVTTGLVGVGPGDELPPGTYVELCVCDDGRSLDLASRRHLFDPFRTTTQGGLRLGLQSSRRIIEQHGGHIRVTSQTERGTCISVRLPCAERAPAALAPTTGTCETVLLVEDEELVRRTVVRGLASLGYDLLVAADGEEALEVAAEHDGPIHVLVTDVVLPGLGGVALASKLALSRPATQVLFVSGHHGDVIDRHGGCDDASFLAKPYRIESLVRMIRAAVERGGAPASGPAPTDRPNHRVGSY